MGMLIVPAIGVKLKYYADYVYYLALAGSNF